MTENAFMIFEKANIGKILMQISRSMLHRNLHHPNPLIGMHLHKVYPRR